MTEYIPSSNFSNNKGRSSPQVSPPPPPTNSPRSESGLSSVIGIAKRQALVIVGVTVTFFGYSAWNVLNEPTQYSGNFQILVEPVNAENANLAAPTGSDSKPQRSSLDYPTQIAILKSPELLGKVAEDLQDTYSNLNYGQLVNKIDISRMRDTKLLQVTYGSNSATQTQTVLETLADKYLQYSLNERQTYLRQGLQFVDDQLETLRAELNGLQNKLEDFQQKNSLVDPSTLSSQISERASALGQRQQQLEQEIVATQSQASILNQDRGVQVALEQDPNYQALQTQIREIDAQIAIELTRFRPENPAIQSLQKQRDNLIPLLEEQAEQFVNNRLAEANGQTQSLRTQLQSVKAAQANLEAQIRQVPALSRQYITLQKEIDITSASLTDFLETRQTLQVEAAQREIPWELVREPVASPIESDTVQALLTALLTGLALGGAAAYAIDKLDNTYHSAEQLKAKVNFPVLGILPFNQQLFLNGELGAYSPRRKHKILSQVRSLLMRSSTKVSKSMSAIALSLIDEYDTSAEFVESLRVINANLQTIHSTQRIRTVTISSTSPGDGKSTLALNWAETAVSVGQRVLLIDGVLRNPTLHHTLNLPNNTGLSDLLMGKAKPPEGLQQVCTDEKLYVITGGSPSSHPVKLLSSARMPQILSYYKKFFDLIIIDAPPLSGLADAGIINRQTDGLVLVTRLDQTDKSLLQQTVEDLRSTDAAVLGMVINGHKGHNLTLYEVGTSSNTSPSEPLSKNGRTSAQTTDLIDIKDSL